MVGEMHFACMIGIPRTPRLIKLIRRFEHCQKMSFMSWKVKSIYLSRKNEPKLVSLSSFKVFSKYEYVDLSRIMTII